MNPSGRAVSFARAASFPACREAFDLSAKPIAENWVFPKHSSPPVYESSFRAVLAWEGRAEMHVCFWRSNRRLVPTVASSALSETMMIHSTINKFAVYAAKVVCVVAGERTSQHDLHRRGTAKDIYSKFRLRACLPARAKEYRSSSMPKNEKKEKKRRIVRTGRSYLCHESDAKAHNDTRSNAEGLALIIARLRRAFDSRYYNYAYTTLRTRAAVMTRESWKASPLCAIKICIGSALI